MKEMYITFNSYTKEYIYYETIPNGTSQKNRLELGRTKEGLLGKLSELIDKKRKSILHLTNIPNPPLEKIKNYFSKISSKIKIKVE